MVRVDFQSFFEEVLSFGGIETLQEQTPPSCADVRVFALLSYGQLELVVGALEVTQCPQGLGSVRRIGALRQILEARFGFVSFSVAVESPAGTHRVGSGGG